MGNDKNYFLVALKKADEEPNADYHLGFTMRAEMNFFRKHENADNWKSRLDYLDQIDKSLSPIFEAVYFFGKWKKENDFEFALKSLEKFREMEGLAYEKNWQWVLSFCITEQVNLCFELKRDEDLKAMAVRIVDYLAKGKECFRPHTFLELTRQFTRLDDCSTPFHAFFS